MRRALLTLAVLVACKDKPPAPPPPPAPPHDGVKLIQPGTGPLQALRYRFVKGARTASTLVCEVAIKSDGQGDTTPPLVVELETLVDDVASDGTAKLRFTLTGAHLQHEASSELQAAVAALPGVIITETIAPDGASSGARVETAGAAPDKARGQLDSLLQSLAHVTTQLPAEAVGVGATWTERRTLPPGGIRGIAETVYTLTGLTPHSFTYTSAGQLSGGPQTIERDGVTIEVTHTAGHSEAKGTVELARYALDVDVHTTFTSTMNAIAPKDTPGSGSSTVEITMATRMTPAPDPAAPTSDAGPDDAGPGDAGPDDAGTSDAGPSDAGASDAGAP